MSETQNGIADKGKSVPKEERCRLADCPSYGKNLKSCSKCTGPVVWKDEQGRKHGHARSCHNCPNNGLGLPVCWAACPGPNSDYQTDGQTIVTLGALEDPDGFIQEQREQSFSKPDYEGDSVIDAIQSEPDDERHSYDSTVTEKLTNDTETACRIVFSNLMSLDETNLRIFYWLYQGQEYSETANSISASNAKQPKITKQAVHKRAKIMARNNRWMRYFVKSLNLKECSGGGSNRGRRKGNVFQPDLFDDAMMRDMMTEHGALCRT